MFSIRNIKQNTLKIIKGGEIGRERKRQEEIIPYLNFFHLFVQYRVQQCVVLQVKDLVYTVGKRIIVRVGNIIYVNSEHQVSKSFER